jgi:hypothetical protein
MKERQDLILDLIRQYYQKKDEGEGIVGIEELLKEEVKRYGKFDTERSLYSLAILQNGDVFSIFYYLNSGRIYLFHAPLVLVCSSKVIVIEK